jgi:hypothetical protein
MAKGSAKKRPARPNAKGRNNHGGQFVRLPHRLLESRAYGSLDLTARALLQELIMVYKGDNNGSLYLSAEDATARLGLTDKRPALRAFSDLQERGFIELAKDAHFSIKAADTSRARCWRLTWEAWPEAPKRTRRAPTNDWEQYEPTGGTPASRRADRRLRAFDRYRKAVVAGRLPGVDFTLMERNMSQKHTEPGVDFTPANSETHGKPPFPVGVDFTPYLDTRGSHVLCWWGSEHAGQIVAQMLLLQVVIQNWPSLAKAA